MSRVPRIYKDGLFVLASALSLLAAGILVTGSLVKTATGAGLDDHVFLSGGGILFSDLVRLNAQLFIEQASALPARAVVAGFGLTFLRLFTGYAALGYSTRPASIWLRTFILSLSLRVVIASVFGILGARLWSSPWSDEPWAGPFVVVVLATLTLGVARTFETVVLLRSLGLPESSSFVSPLQGAASDLWRRPWPPLATTICLGFGGTCVALTLWASGLPALEKETGRASALFFSALLCKVALDLFYHRALLFSVGSDLDRPEASEPRKS